MSARPRWIAWIFAIAALLVAQAATAATTIYGIRGTATAGVNNIVRIDGSTGAATTVYTGYPGGDAAAMAQCPNGLIYYALTASPYQLYVFNPQTPAVAPVALGSGLTFGASRMACSPSGVLYYMADTILGLGNLFTINTTTGAISSTAVTVLLAPVAGDIAFNSTGTMYLLSTNNNLFTVPLGGGTVTTIGAVSGLNGSALGLAFDASDVAKALTNGSPDFFTLSGTVATSLSTVPGGTSGGNLASVAVPNPDLSITTTSNVASVLASTATAVTYTLVVTNSSAYAVTGTVVDTFPTGVSAITWTCAASSGSSCAAASGSGNINTKATLLASGTATYTVSATVTATTTVVNTATVALPFSFLTDATPANNTASNSILVRPGVTKTFGVASMAINASTTLTITIANPNTGAITLSSAFTDTLPTSPAAMTVGTAGNSGTCTGVTATAGAAGVTMANGTSIAAGGCTIVVNVTAGQPGSYTNTIAAGQLSTSAGTSPTAASATLTVNGPAFTILKSSTVFSDPSNGTTNPKAIPGGIVTYTVQVTNGGPASPDSNATVITDAVPTNTALYVGNLANPSGPVSFTNQGSGLTYTYVSLSSTTDDLAFSNVDCVTFTYTPVADAAGFDAAVKCLRLNPKGVFANNVSTPPAFTFQFRVRVN